MSEGPSPAQLVGAARIALRQPGQWGGAWQRAVAFLARQALEDAVARVWHGDTAPMADAPMTHQLLCLPYYLDDPDLANRARHTWHALSSACHAHPYDLAPTIAELDGWLAQTEAAVAALGA